MNKWCYVETVTQLAYSDTRVIQDTHMYYAIVFRYTTSAYGIHAQNCKHAHHTKHQYCWIFEDGNGNTLEAAVASCHEDESEKAGKPTKAKVKICPCAKV